MELLQAKDIMVRDYQVVPETLGLLEAVDRMRLVELQTKKIDVRCLVVTDPKDRPFALLTEADIIRAVLPWFFRERRFSDFVGKWLSKDLPMASLAELWGDLARSARKKTVKDVLADIQLISVDEEDSLLKVAYVMHLDKIKSVPVMKDGKITGIVFRTAVFEAIAEEIVKPGHRTSKAEIKSPNPA